MPRRKDGKRGVTSPRPIVVNGVSYRSMRAAEMALGFVEGTIRRRMKEGLSGDDLVRPVRRCKAVPPRRIVIKGVVYPSMRSVDRAFGFVVGTTAQRIRRWGWSGDRLGTPTRENIQCSSTKVEIDGVSKTVDEWLALNGISKDLYYTRIEELEWSLKDSCTVPPGDRVGSNNTAPRWVMLKGRMYRACEAARMIGISPMTLIKRLNAGWTEEQYSDPKSHEYDHFNRRSDAGPSKWGRIRRMAAEYGLKYQTVLQRDRSGWSESEIATKPLHYRGHSVMAKRRRELASLGVIV